jgi:hypothetical protein
MKKNIICFVFALILITKSSLIAQKIEKDSISGNYISVGIVPIDSISKDNLYSRSLEWITLNYKSAKDVIQLSNKEDGKIICKGTFPVSLYLKEGWIEHTLTLDFKDNKFRYTYSSFSYYSSGSGRVSFDGTMMGKKNAISTTEDKIQKSIENLTQYLKSKTIKSGDGW